MDFVKDAKMEPSRPRGLSVIQACMILLIIPTIAISYNAWWINPHPDAATLAAGVSFAWGAVIAGLVWVWLGLDAHDLDQRRYIDDILVDLVVSMSMLVISGTALAA